MNKQTIISVAILAIVIVLGFLLLKPKAISPVIEDNLPAPTSTTTPPKATDTPKDVPTRETVVGTWECLPVKNPDQPHTLECAFGIELADGSGHLGVNTNNLPNQPVDYPTGTKLKITGLVVPVEQLSSNQWQKFNMKGIIAADSIEIVK